VKSLFGKDVGHRRHGLTLVELLVVVGILGLLMAVTLPVLSRSRRQARMTVELAGSRQLMQAYLMYAAENDGQLIPGHTSQAPALEDDLGRRLMHPEAAKRWPWRLLSETDCGLFGTILVNGQASELADRDAPLWSYMVSLTPTFGLNYYNLGGDLTAHGANNAPGCIQRLSQATDSSRRIVFASSRSVGPSGVVEGYFKIVPPTKPFEYSASGWTTQPYDEAGEPAAWGYVHPRHFDTAIVGHLDGHSGRLSIDELRDMTRWSEPAARAGNTGWRAE
jgi:prepilin-type N-terminal cleavage/methylation domain-containing protein